MVEESRFQNRALPKCFWLKGGCLFALHLSQGPVQDTMESVQKEQASSSRSWVLRNTFIEFVEDGADEFASCLMRASSDSVLYEGYSRTQVTEPQVREPRVSPEGKREAAAAASDEPMDSEAGLCSDAETNPDTNEGEKSLPLLCYSHIDSGVSTPNAAQEGSDFEQYVTRTPSLRGMDWQSRFEAADLLPRDEEIRSDPMPDLVPPIHHHSHATSSEAERGGASAPSKQDLRRLAAEVARLEQENNLLRRMAQGPKQEPVASPSQQIGGMAWAMASAVDFTQHQDSRNGWLQGLERSSCHNSPAMHEHVQDEYKAVQHGDCAALPEPWKTFRYPRDRKHHRSKAAGSRHRRQAFADAPKLLPCTPGHVSSR